MYRNKNKLKYYGVLNGYDIDSINESLIDVLIKKHIIVLERDFKLERSHKKEKRYAWMDEIENSSEFSFCIYFNHKQYRVLNNVFLELYNVIEQEIVFDAVNYDYQIDGIRYKLNRFIDIDAKISFLKDFYEEHYPEDTLFGIFNEDIIYQRKTICANKIERKLYRSWKEIVISELKGSRLWIEYLIEDSNILEEAEYDIFEKIFQYTLSSQDIGEIINNWVYFIEASEINRFVLSEIQELEKLKSGQKPNITHLKEAIVSDKLYDSLIEFLIGSDLVTKHDDGTLEFMIPHKYRKRRKMLLSAFIHKMKTNRKVLLKDSFKKNDKLLIDIFNNTFKTTDSLRT